MNNLKTKILETVNKNTIKMIPKWKFVLYSSFAIIAMVFAFLIAVFVCSLVLFTLTQYGFMYMPMFGLAGIFHTLRAIPTLLLICTIVLLIIIETISRYYSFSFRRPLAVTLLLLTSSTVLLSFFISQTRAHEYIREYALGHHFDAMEHMYDRPLPFREHDGKTIIRGTVLSSTATGTLVKLFDGSRIVAFKASSSDDFLTTAVGDDIVIVGTYNGTTFEIAGVKEASAMPFGGRMYMMNDREDALEKMMK